MFNDFDRFWSSIGIIDVLRPEYSSGGSRGGAYLHLARPRYKEANEPRLADGSKWPCSLYFSRMSRQSAVYPIKLTRTNCRISQSHKLQVLLTRRFCKGRDSIFLFWTTNFELNAMTCMKCVARQQTIVALTRITQYATPTSLLFVSFVRVLLAQRNLGTRTGLFNMTSSYLDLAKPKSGATDCDKLPLTMHNRRHPMHAQAMAFNCHWQNFF